jgi:hypothetical protein
MIAADPRTPEERAEDAREWAELLAELWGRTAAQVLFDDEQEAKRDYDEERRSVEADARWYFGQ